MVNNWTYITDCLHGICSLSSVKSTIAIFVIELRNNQVSIADNTVSVQIIADVGHVGSFSLLLNLS